MGGSYSVAGAQNYLRTAEVGRSTSEVRTLVTKAKVQVELLKRTLEEQDNIALERWNDYIQATKRFASGTPRLRLELVSFVEAERVAFKTAMMRESLRRWIERTERALLQSSVDDVVLSAEDPMARLHANAHPREVLQAVEAMIANEEGVVIKNYAVIEAMDAQTKSEMDRESARNGENTTEEYYRRLEAFARKQANDELGLEADAMTRAGEFRRPTMEQLEMTALLESL